MNLSSLYSGGTVGKSFGTVISKVTSYPNSNYPEEQLSRDLNQLHKPKFPSPIKHIKMKTRVDDKYTSSYRN